MSGNDGKKGNRYSDTAKLSHSEAQRVYDLGCQLLENDSCEKAVTQFNKALEIYPEHAAILNNLGQAYQLLDRWEEAESVYRDAIPLFDR